MSILAYVLTVAWLANGAHGACKDSVGLSVVSRRNMTGHWTTDATVTHDTGADRSVGLALALGTDCENKKRVVLTATLTLAPPLPGPGYELFPGVGRYKFHNESRNWDDALAVCESESAHLAVLNSETEAKVLEKLFARHPNSNVWAFIGFHDQYDEGHYVTVFGDSLNNTGFSRWSSPGQPDNYKGIENCGSIHRNGGLNDIPCTANLPFICEQELW